MYMVNNYTELDTEILGFKWEDYYEGRKKVGVYCKIYYKDNYDSQRNGSLDIIIYDKKPGFTVKGSLRKFYYGKNNAVADLTPKQFCKCITRIASQLQLPVNEIWFSDFTFLEFGANITLPAAYKILMYCLSTFSRRKKNGYEGETVYFKNKSKENKFYDKLCEIFSKGGMTKKVYETLSSYVFSFRYEVRLRPANIKNFSENKVIDIYNNWNFFIEYWKKEFEKVRFENRTPINIDLTEGSIGLKEIKNCFISRYIESIGGLDEAEKIIHQSNAERKAKYFRNISEIYVPNHDADFKQMIETLNQKVKEVAKEKAREI
jgi:hypothetical protein